MKFNETCRAFTPQLAEWYKKFKEGPNGDKFDIVFVSSDRDDKSWKEYFAEMPWKALDFADRDKKVRHGLYWIRVPCHVIFGPRNIRTSHADPED